MPADPAHLIRLALATGGQGAAHQALQLALGVARLAGEEVLRAQRHLPPGEQLALALQAADEALEGLAVQLAEGDGGEAEGK